MEHITHAVRREYWAGIIKECNESGMKKCDWMSLHNISPKVFYRWQRLIRMESGAELLAMNTADETPKNTTTSFIALPEPRTALNSASSSVRISFGTVTMEINESISDNFLQRILKAASNA